MSRYTAMLVFVRTVETGSFAAAAALLGISSQAAGKHIRELEKHFRTRLLNRSTRTQSLTEVGRLYYEQCKRALAEMEAADAILAAQGKEPHGTLRIAAPVSFASNHLAPLLTEFMAQFPEVGVDLTVTGSPGNFIDEGYDLIFRIGAAPDSTLKVRTLARHHTIVCAAQDYLNRRGSPIVPEDLKSHQCLGLPLSSNSPRTSWQFKRGGKTYSVSVGGTLRISDERALVSAALEGAGILIGCRSSMAPHVREGRLVRLLADYKIPTLPINVLFTARPHMPNKLRTFLDWIVGKCKERARRIQLADV